MIEQHLRDLAARADARCYTTYSDFLNQNEISLLHSLQLKTTYALFGGYRNAERCVAAFGEDIDEHRFPIVLIAMEPLNQKFADTLTHRDYLGALMHLGINRNTLGDIQIKDNVGYLFCLESISEYITDNLTNIRHTTVRCRIVTQAPDFINRLPDVTEMTVASLRLDAVIAAVYKLSRNGAASLIKQEKVFINARVTAKESVPIKDGDTVSVRGCGRFRFDGTVRTTKKDRLVIAVRIY